MLPPGAIQVSGSSKVRSSASREKTIEPRTSRDRSRPSAGKGWYFIDWVSTTYSSAIQIIELGFAVPLCLFEILQGGILVSLIFAVLQISRGRLRLFVIDQHDANATLPNAHGCFKKLDLALLVNTRHHRWHSLLLQIHGHCGPLSRTTTSLYTLRRGICPNVKRRRMRDQEGARTHFSNGGGGHPHEMPPSPIAVARPSGSGSQCA